MKISIYIEILQDKKTIYIPPYHMDRVEHNEFKEQFKHFLNKGLIQPCITP